MWYHQEENAIIGPLLTYEQEHPHAKLLLVYADSSSCHAVLITSYESDNENLVECNPFVQYDEFYVVLYEVLDIVRRGMVNDLIVDGMLEVDYRHAPVKIIDEARDTVVYALQERS